MNPLIPIQQFFSFFLWSSSSFLLFSSLLLSQDTSFVFKDAGLRNLITLSSDAWLEYTLAISHALSGNLSINLQNLAGTFSGEFIVDPRTFSTGHDAKDELIRDQVFSTSQYSDWVIKIEKIKSYSRASILDGQTVTIKGDSLMKFRGVTKSQPVTIKLSYIKESYASKLHRAGNLLKLSLNFDLDWQQYSGNKTFDSTRSKWAKVFQVSLQAIGSDKMEMGGGVDIVKGK